MTEFMNDLVDNTEESERHLRRSVVSDADVMREMFTAFTAAGASVPDSLDVVDVLANAIESDPRVLHNDPAMFVEVASDLVEEFILSDVDEDDLDWFYDHDNSIIERVFLTDEFAGKTGADILTALRVEV